MAKKKKSSLGVRVLNFALIALVLLSLLIDALYIYYKHINKDITIGVNYITTQLAIKDAESMSEEEREQHERRTLLIANLYSNDKGNGIQLQELKINYFTDYTLDETTYRSSGMQYVGDVSIEDFKLTGGHAFGITTDFIDENQVSSRFDYYDTTNGIAWSGFEGVRGVSTKFNREENFIISINGEAYSIQLNKTKEYDYTVLFEISRYTDYANWGELFQFVMNAIKNNNQGYGDYYITLDLSDFFTIRKFDKETGKFVKDDVTDIIKNYAVLKFHYDENGAVKANQSLFGAIECNNSYGYTAEDISQYWQERFVFDLTNENLQSRYSEVHGGQLLSLKTVDKIKFSQMKRVKIYITISKEEGIIGLDYNAFQGVPITELVIIGDGYFVLLENSLIDTNIKTIKYSSTIDLVIKDGAINSDYEEVVV
ncbi:MAG: hypothetical protein IJZ29_04325 [Clostridia bacterium]|nr:hypothetical protein [Clostridia bacterium]